MIEYILKTLAPKLFKAIQPLLNQAFPKLLENNLQVILEKVKSELRQEEIQNEAKLKARGALLAFDEVKNVPLPVATLALRQVFLNTANQELENAVKSMQSANISKENIDPNFFSPNNDWFREFIKLSGKFSSEDAHKLWGKILETEAKQQGSISYKTMAKLSELTPKECKAFQSLFPYIINDEFISKELVHINGLDRYNNELFLLEEVGLLKYITAPCHIAPQPKYKDGKAELIFNTYKASLKITISQRPKKNTNNTFDVTPFPSITIISLTQSAKELYLAFRNKELYDCEKAKEHLYRIGEYYQQYKPLSNVEWEIISPDENN